MGAKTITREENDMTITYRQGLPKAAPCGRLGVLVRADYGVRAEIRQLATTTDCSYELRREVGAVVAGATRDKDMAAEYVLYRDGEFLVRCASAVDAYDRMAVHGCRSQYRTPGDDLEASMGR